MTDTMTETKRLEITSLGRKGEGIADDQGRPVFIPRALPGEIVRASVSQDKQGILRGQMLEIESASAARRAPPCPYYEGCGGCMIQHWDEGAYRKWKANFPLDMLARAGVKVQRVHDPVFIPARTRRRTTLTLFKQDQDMRVGYRRFRSHEITDIPDCLLLTPGLQSLKERLRPDLAPLLSDSRPAQLFIQDTGDAVELLFTGTVGKNKKPDQGWRNEAANLAEAHDIARIAWRAKDRDTPQVILSRRKMKKAAGVLDVTLPPGAFLQPSAEGEAALLAAVLAPFAGASGLRIADLFAGCGTFSGPFLAQGEVLAIESDQAMVSALGKAGRGAGNLVTEKRDLFGNPLAGTDLAGMDAVVLDPPRAGAKAQSAALAESPVPLIIYVSCNPAAFARDAALLCGGGYQLADITIIDQFIYSAHTELVAVFQR